MTTLVLMLVLGGCGGTEPKSAAPPPAAAPSPTLPAEAVKEAATDVLAPSPRETREAVEKAGIQLDVAKLVPVRNYKMDATDRDVVAVRTGVLLADSVLTLKEAPTADIEGRLAQVRAGLVTLGAGQGLLNTVDGIRDRFVNGAASRDALLTELDEVVAMAIPGQGVGPDDRTGPLLQAGAWLSATHVVASALVQADRRELGDQLLRQKTAADWFLGYVRAGAEGRAPEDILKRIEATLGELSAIAGKPTLAPEDVNTVRDRTGELLSLL